MPLGQAIAFCVTSEEVVVKLRADFELVGRRVLPRQTGAVLGRDNVRRPFQGIVGVVEGVGVAQGQGNGALVVFQMNTFGSAIGVRPVLGETALATVETVAGFIAPKVVHETAVFEGVRRQGGAGSGRMVAHRSAVVSSQIQRQRHRLVLVDGTVVAGSERKGRMRPGGIDRHGITDAVCIIPHR